MSRFGYITRLVILTLLLESSQGLTIDSLIPEGANPRLIAGKEVVDIVAYYEKHNPAHLAAANARVLPKPSTVVGSTTVGTTTVGTTATTIDTITTESISDEL